MDDALSCYYMGQEAFERQDYPEAIRCFERSNALDEHFKTYEMLYWCWKRLSDNEKAFACIEYAYRLNPKSDKTAFEYAEMLAETGNRSLALEVLSGIQQRNRDYKKAAVLSEALSSQS